MEFSGAFSNGYSRLRRTLVFVFVNIENITSLIAPPTFFKEILVSNLRNNERYIRLFYRLDSLDDTEFAWLSKDKTKKEKEEKWNV